MELTKDQTTRLKRARDNLNYELNEFNKIKNSSLDKKSLLEMLYRFRITMAFVSDDIDFALQNMKGKKTTVKRK